MQRTVSKMSPTDSYLLIRTCYLGYLKIELHKVIDLLPILITVSYIRDSTLSV